MASGGLHISISAERLFSIGSLDISNSILTSLIVSGLIIAFTILVRVSLDKSAAKPSPLQNFAEWLVESFYSLVHGVTNDHKKTRVFLPFIFSFFMFILLNNWFGLLPGVGTIGMIEGESTEHAQLLPQKVKTPVGEVMASTTESVEDAQQTGETEEVHEEVLPASPEGEENAATEEAAGAFVPYFRPGTADLNTTLALGLLSMFMVQFYGFKYQNFAYLKKFFNFSSPIMFFVGILEIISDTAKIVSFAFRLFGNIFAGEVLLVVISSLIPIIAPMPFYGLEVFVGFIQALVFSLLTLVFFNMATIGHDEH